jgi:hypothetical protein
MGAPSWGEQVINSKELQTLLQKDAKAERQWLTYVILATQEAEVRRVTV